MAFWYRIRTAVIVVAAMALVLVALYYLSQNILTELFTVFISFIVIDAISGGLLKGGKGFFKSPILGNGFISKERAFVIFIAVVLISAYISTPLSNIIYQELGVTSFNSLPVYYVLLVCAALSFITYLYFKHVY
jgi:hypothetical protein